MSAAIGDVRVARTEADVRLCFAAYKELRPHLRSAEELVERWKKQVKEGFELIFIAEGDKATAAAGYRFLNTTAWGHVLYVDDLVALTSHHKKGLGTTLLKYIQEEARRKGCDEVHLDTGYQRHLAHLAYLRNGFKLLCHHMSWVVTR